MNDDNPRRSDFSRSCLSDLSVRRAGPRFDKDKEPEKRVSVSSDGARSLGRCTSHSMERVFVRNAYVFIADEDGTLLGAEWNARVHREVRNKGWYGASYDTVSVLYIGSIKVYVVRVTAKREIRVPGGRGSRNRTGLCVVR